MQGIFQSGPRTPIIADTLGPETSVTWGDASTHAVSPHRNFDIAVVFSFYVPQGQMVTKFRATVL